jgi:chromosome segregation ATPase
MKTSLLALVVVCAACKTTVNEPETEAPVRSSIVVGEPSRLYARDGSVVDASGTPVPGGTSDAPVRAVGERDGSRTYLLELYQKAMDDKDQLTVEVQALQAQLDLERKEKAALQAERDEARAAATAAQAQTNVKEAELRDLSGRLVQAQIKRLEAEKLLLEHLVATQSATPAPQGGGQ